MGGVRRRVSSPFLIRRVTGPGQDTARHTCHVSRVTWPLILQLHAVPGNVMLSAEAEVHLNSCLARHLDSFILDKFAHKSMSSTTGQKTKLIFIICSEQSGAGRGGGRGNLVRASANFHDKLGGDCTVLYCTVRALVKTGRPRDRNDEW